MAFVVGGILETACDLGFSWEDRVGLCVGRRYEKNGRTGRTAERQNGRTAERQKQQKWQKRQKSRMQNGSTATY